MTHYLQSFINVSCTRKYWIIPQSFNYMHSQKTFEIVYSLNNHQKKKKNLSKQI